MIAAFAGMKDNGEKSAINMIALALAMSRVKDVRIILLESGFGEHCVEDAMISRTENLVADPFAYMEGEGMDYLMKRSRHEMLCEKTVGEGVVYVKENLGFVPGAIRKNRPVYEMSFNRECQNILKQLNKIADYVFVNCSGVPEKVQNKIQEMAGMVIVNVAQSEHTLDEYFSCPPPYHHKSFYCIGNYINEEPYNVKNIQRLYRLEKQQIGIVPYNVEFLSAVQKGKALSFFEGHPIKPRYNRNKDFFNELFKMANTVLYWKEWMGLEGRC